MNDCTKQSKKICSTCKHCDYCDKPKLCDGNCKNCDIIDCENNPNYVENKRKQIL